MANSGARNALDRALDDLERIGNEFESWTHGLSPIPDGIRNKVNAVLTKATKDLQKIKSDL